MLNDDVDVGSSPTFNRQKVLEIKNEEFQQIGKGEIAALGARFRGLQVLNLSMNKI